MKKAIIFCAFLCISATTFCQQTIPSHTYTREDYLKKSKQKKTVAWVLFGSGVTLTAFALAQKDWEKGFIPIILGIPLTITSFPFFNSAARYKRKAMDVAASIKLENATSFQQHQMIHSTHPSLYFKITF